MRKVYLGDGVYASFDGYQVRLTTEYGEGQATNEIYLGPSTYCSLVQFVDRANSAILEGAAEQAAEAAEEAASNAR